MGNPNVGKSTLFNKLTGKKQHTGNWAGKTVDTAVGTYKTKITRYSVIDLPGIYSLSLRSPEEKIAKDYLLNETYDAVLVICDATDLYRNLKLALEVISICPRVIVCVNMLDEAQRKEISINIDGMSRELGVPVIGCSAKKDVSAVKESLCLIDSLPTSTPHLPHRDELIKKYVTYNKKDINERDKKIDKILCGKYTRIPVMILFLLIILWLTVSGANYPSNLLSKLLFYIGDKLELLMLSLSAPAFLIGIFVDGAYNVLAQVVSVMLPPMAIFFPLFALLEESGFLPRIAYNLDSHLTKCGGTGKQALTMCMGLGCNAVGVMNSRIIPSKKQQLISILTNSFMPCNGRFPTIILLISVILGGTASSFLGATLLTFFILLSIVVTFAVTYFLSRTLKGENISPTIELPTYRKPDIFKTLADSFLNKTLHILGRAAVVAAPAGAILWLINNIRIGDASLLSWCASFLEPLGKLLCMDSVILIAFILGSPANEIVLPIAVMIYMGAGSMSGIGNEEMKAIFINNGWDGFTALSVIFFSLFHWPCTTTLLTIKKETDSLKYTALAVFIPTAVGTILCLLLNLIKVIYTG